MLHFFFELVLLIRCLFRMRLLFSVIPLFLLLFSAFAVFGSLVAINGLRAISCTLDFERMNYWGYYDIPFTHTMKGLYILHASFRTCSTWPSARCMQGHALHSASAHA